VALWIAVILAFSSEEFAAQHTAGFLGPLLRTLFPQLDAAELLRLHLLVRKTAHLAEYALLGLLGFRALRLSLALPSSRLALLGLGLVAAVAAADELRQAYLPNRTGAVADVALDVAGGALGLALIVALHRALGIGDPARSEPRGPRAAAPPCA
jgi:VanZ family protein